MKRRKTHRQRWCTRKNHLSCSAPYSCTRARALARSRIRWSSHFVFSSAITRCRTRSRSKSTWLPFAFFPSVRRRDNAAFGSFFRGKKALTRTKSQKKSISFSSKRANIRRAKKHRSRSIRKKIKCQSPPLLLLPPLRFRSKAIKGIGFVHPFLGTGARD
jgi:hypothetical protein